MSTTDNLSAALASDPQLKSLGQQVELLGESARLTAKRWPTIEASMQYQRLPSYYSKYYNSFNENDFSVGVSLRIPIWAGGRLDDTEARAKASVHRVEAERTARESDLEVAVRRSEASVARAAAEQSLARRAQGIAEQDLAAAELLVQEGRAEAETVEQRRLQLADADEDAAARALAALEERVKLLSLRGELAKTVLGPSRPAPRCRRADSGPARVTSSRNRLDRRIDQPSRRRVLTGRKLDLDDRRPVGEARAQVEALQNLARHFDAPALSSIDRNGGGASRLRAVCARRVPQDQIQSDRGLEMGEHARHFRRGSGGSFAVVPKAAHFGPRPMTSPRSRRHSAVAASPLIRIVNRSTPGRTRESRRMTKDESGGTAAHRAAAIASAETMNTVQDRRVERGHSVAISAMAISSRAVAGTTTRPTGEIRA